MPSEIRLTRPRRASKTLTPACLRAADRHSIEPQQGGKAST
jgi:hypothetical protein